jgi:hypothetical protein
MGEKSWRAVYAVVAGSVLLTACRPADAKDAEPMPTTVSGDLVCGFVSKDSAVTAVGTRDILVTGDKLDLGDTRNPDGSRLNLAGCSVNTKDVKNALAVDVLRLSELPSVDSQVTEVVASGKPSFVFPEVEGKGYAWADAEDSLAADAQLIRGDWRYRVVITNSSDGRNAVDDAVAILRQVVTQLGLPA